MPLILEPVDKLNIKVVKLIDKYGIEAVLLSVVDECNFKYVMGDGKKYKSIADDLVKILNKRGR